MNGFMSNVVKCIYFVAGSMKITMRSQIVTERESGKVKSSAFLKDFCWNAEKNSIFFVNISCTLNDRAVSYLIIADFCSYNGRRRFAE